MKNIKTFLNKRRNLTWLVTLLFGYWISSACYALGPQHEIEKESDQKSIPAPSSECPKAFNKIKIPIDSKLCQVFAADYPASMIFFIPQKPNQVVKQYLETHPQLSQLKTTNRRTLLQTADKNTILIVSPDGIGSQVDILVKSPS